MVINESGDVKVLTEKGVVKWLPKHISENKIVMTAQHLTLAPSPIVPKKPPVSEAKTEVPALKTESLVPEPKEELNTNKVATPSAKRGPKPKKK